MRMRVPNDPLMLMFGLKFSDSLFEKEGDKKEKKKKKKTNYADFVGQYTPIIVILVLVEMDKEKQLTNYSFYLYINSLILFSVREEKKIQ